MVFAQSCVAQLVQLSSETLATRASRARLFTFNQIFPGLQLGATTLFVGHRNYE
jgi:hypothetical protein